MRWFAERMAEIYATKTPKEPEKPAPPKMRWDDETPAFLAVLRRSGMTTLGGSAFDTLWEEMPYAVRRDIFELALRAAEPREKSK